METRRSRTETGTRPRTECPPAWCSSSEGSDYCENCVFSWNFNSPKKLFHHFETRWDHLNSLPDPPSAKIINNVMKSASQLSLSVCDAVWVPEWSPVQMYFVYFYSILATLYTVHSTSQCTVLSSALAHFANLDSVLWGKLEKLCQFKVLNSAKQLCTFSNSSAKMHLCHGKFVW